MPRKVVSYDDHLGGIVHDVSKDSIKGLNWGSRNASTWELNSLGSADCPKRVRVRRNPSYFIDYRDCKFLSHSAIYGGRPVMLCGGMVTLGSDYHAYDLGGVAIVDVETMVPLDEVPITLTSALGVTLTQNPIDASVEDGKLRLYLQPDSPYEM